MQVNPPTGPQSGPPPGWPGAPAGPPGAPAWPPQPGSYPLGSYPAGGYPPGSYPPGSYVPGGTPPARTKKMRKGWIIGGIVMAVLGLLVVIGGAIALVVSRTASSLDPVAQGNMPGTTAFVAEAQKYDVMLVTSRRTSAEFSANVDCTVTLSDGSTLTLDGSRQAVATDVGNTQSIGSFTALAGPTQVFCAAGSADGRFIVDEESALAKIAIVVLFVGVGLLLLGIGLTLAGVFWKKAVPSVT